MQAKNGFKDASVGERQQVEGGAVGEPARSRSRVSRHLLNEIRTAFEASLQLLQPFCGESGGTQRSLRRAENEYGYAHRRDSVNDFGNSRNHPRAVLLLTQAVPGSARYIGWLSRTRESSCCDCLEHDQVFGNLVSQDASDISAGAARIGSARQL